MIKYAANDAYISLLLYKITIGKYFPKTFRKHENSPKLVRKKPLDCPINIGDIPEINI